MQIILSSAKLMNATTSVLLSKLTEPLFCKEADKFALELGQHTVVQHEFGTSS